MIQCPYYAHNCTCLAKRILSKSLYVPTLEEEMKLCKSDSFKDCPYYTKAVERDKQGGGPPGMQMPVNYSGGN